MAELSRPWAGAVLGDAGPYSDDLWDDIWEILYGSGTAPYNDRGVIRNWANELEVTDGGGDEVDVDTGAALVHGKFYQNTAVVNVVLPIAVGIWREDLICLQCDYAAQTIRIFRHNNPADVAGYPPPLQNPGVIWEIPLAAARIDNGGNIIGVTDLRDYVSDLMQPKQLQVRPGLMAATGGEWGLFDHHHGVQLDTAGEEAYLEFMVPLDFLQLISGHVRFGVAQNGTLDWTVDMRAGPCGGDLSAVADTATADGVVLTHNEIHCLDITSALDGLAAGDEVGMTFRVDALLAGTTDILVLLLDFRYK